MEASIELDAREFGLHVRQGQWRLGLLVARNVRPGTGGPRPSVSIETVSAREFAELAGTSAARVMRYLKAWDKAAMGGHVPPSSELSPGEEVDLDVDKLPPWDMYYDASERKREVEVEITAKEVEEAEVLLDELRSKAHPENTLFCRISSAEEFIRGLEVGLKFILGSPYELNDTDLRRLKVALEEALEKIEVYVPLEAKKSSKPVKHLVKVQGIPGPAVTPVSKAEVAKNRHEYVGR